MTRHIARRLADLEKRRSGSVVVWTTRDATPCPPDRPGALLVIVNKP